MSDLQLESTNNAGETTLLVAVPHDRGANLLKDFVGDVILDVRPTSGLLVVPKDGGFPVTPDPNKNDFGGIRCAGAGTGAGLRAESQAGRGVWGVGNVGVLGAGSGQNAIGVHGTTEGPGVGVRGEGNPGVVGSSAVSSGVEGDGTPGVLGNCSANPIALVPTARPEPGHFAGVKGNSAHGPGVFGTGVYGGQFQGSRAQLSLVPGAGVGKPTTGPHTPGEIYMDQAASLFVCIAGGDPGTWVKLVTVPA
jgi:hypothetical protein